MSFVANVGCGSLLLGLLGLCGCGGKTQGDGHPAGGSEATGATSSGGSAAAGEPGVGGRGGVPASTGGAAGAASGATGATGATATGGAGTAGAPPSDPSHFISVWNTAGTPRSSDENQISLPLVEHGTYDFVVAWGDGTTDEIASWDAPATTHTYPAVGTYTVDIFGVISGWRFTYAGVDMLELGDAGKLEEVIQWGTFSLGDTVSQFWGAENLVITATDAPDLTQTTSLSRAFSHCPRLGSIPSLDAWDVSGVTDMTYMFSASGFDQDLSSWDVSNVTNMSYMFHRSTYNRDLSAWDVSNVTSMAGMFAGTTAFDQDLSAWDVSNVTDMGHMFRESDYNRDLSAWDVSSVTSMTEMFLWSAYDQDLSAWDVSNVTDMSFMFMGTTYNQDLSSWDLSSVVNMTGMFEDSTYDQDLSAWDVSGVTSMARLFRESTYNRDLSTWDVSSVTTMASMFQQSAYDQDLSAWDVSSVTTMASMFQDATLSTANYDALLITWAQRSVQDDVTFDGGSSTYSAAAADARQSLIADHGWIITDGGCSGPGCPDAASGT